MSQSTAPVKGITSKLSIALHMGITGESRLVVDALTIHRDYYFREMFNEIKNGEYENAHSHYEAFSSLSFMLDTLTEKAVGLTLDNYQAETWKNNPQGKEKDRLLKEGLKKEDYQRFLDMILCTTPEDAE